MEPYNFWQDFFDTYQSLSDWVKALWLIVPPAFVLSLTALMMRFRIESKRADHGLTGKLIYSIRRDGESQFHIVSHAPPMNDEPTLLFARPANPRPLRGTQPARRT